MIKNSKELQLAKEIFENFIKDSRFSNLKTNTGTKRLNSKALETYLTPDLKKIEQQDIRIQHISSVINDKPIRCDSKYFTAYAKCIFAKNCPVTYNFNIKEKHFINDYICIRVDINNIHQHSNTFKCVKGDDRNKLGVEIMTKHGGSAFDARLHDLADNGIAANLNVYKKCKSEFRHKDVPTTDWITNLLYIARTYENTKNNFIHELNLYPQFSMQLQTLEALNQLHLVPPSFELHLLIQPEVLSE